MNKKSKIYIAGHRGLVGSALLRRLERAGFHNLLLRTHAELDLLDQNATREFFAREKPEYVFLAAARVGGILANSTRPAQFIHDNLVVETNVIHAAYEQGVKKLLFLGSSCIYPRLAPQPMKEEHLLSGPLEETNKPYAVAKIAGIIMCQSYNKQYGTNFISVMPTNLYGTNDNFDLESAHVLPALIRRFHEAKRDGNPSVVAWGTGAPRREFLHVDDMADACLFLMERYDGDEIVNIGTGEDLSVRELTELVSKVVGYKGDIVWDASKPDGTPRKLLDVSKIQGLGWKHSIALRDGIADTYQWYVQNRA